MLRLKIFLTLVIHITVYPCLLLLLANDLKRKMRNYSHSCNGYQTRECETSSDPDPKNSFRGGGGFV